MRSIRAFVVLAGTAAALISGAFAAPLAVSQTAMGHMSETQILMLNEAPEAEWRLPGGGVRCGSSCPAGMRCCPGGGIVVSS